MLLGHIEVHHAIRVFAVYVALENLLFSLRVETRRRCGSSEHLFRVGTATTIHLIK